MNDALPLILMLLGLAIGVLLGAMWMRARAAGAQAQVSELRRALADRDERAKQDGDVLREIAPLRNELTRMRSSITELEHERLELHGRISEQLRRQAQADAELRDSTSALSAALRSNTARGGWGEAQLQNLLESAGLVEHIDFDLQVHATTDSGAGRPDAIVQLPGGHVVIIDAKAPMSSYLDAMAIPQPGTLEDEQRRKRLLNEHARSVRGHVDALNKRDYPAAFQGSARLTIAYLPSESALSAALAQEPRLLDHAFAQNVALASPVTLWAVLRAVAASWRQQRVDDSAAEVLHLSQDLYRRLSTATGHLQKLGRSLKSSVEAYDQFVGSLESRVLPTARKLGDLDPASAALQTPDRVERTPKQVTADELNPSGSLEEEKLHEERQDGAQREHDTKATHDA